MPRTFARYSVNVIRCNNAIMYALVFSNTVLGSIPGLAAVRLVQYELCSRMNKVANVAENMSLLFSEYRPRSYMLGLLACLGGNSYP